MGPMAPFSHLEVDLSTKDDWAAVVAEMIAAAGDVPIAGAKARVVLERLAQAKGFDFPPVDMIGRKFSDYLESFQEIVSLRKRPGQDFLIAPANKPELLLSSTSRRGGTSLLRSDIYQALTKQRTNGVIPFYRVSSDSVLWQTADCAGSGLIELPSVKPPEELRNAYAAARPLQSGLSDAVASSAAFSKAIRDKRLGRDWHEFRLHSLIEQLKEWAEAHSLAWGDTWIEGGVRADSASPSGMAQEPIDRASRLNEALAGLKAVLSEDELKRISVPMDLVIKLLDMKG